MVYGGLPCSGCRTITMLIRLPIVPFQIAFSVKVDLNAENVNLHHGEDRKALRNIH